MIRLEAWLTLPSGESTIAGTLVVTEPDPVSGALQGQFRYAPDYLDHPQAFPLDPLHLPLSVETFDADRPREGVHGVFEDSLPDDWGRRLMVRRHQLNRDAQRVPNLLRLLGNRGLGALRYGGQGRPEPRITGVSGEHLRELAALAKKFEQGPATVSDHELLLLFQAGSSPGGAQPKALVEDDKGACLAKFPSTGDRLDVVGFEAAAMALAGRAGIETADTRIFSLDAARKCLLVKRFDINAAGGRNHLISMQTLLKADGYYNIGYRDLAEVIRHMSSQPKLDLNRLYRQMVFNVMIGNTDDHLKNFMMLHDDTGWRLSPAFDLLPNIGLNQEHVLRIGPDTRPPDAGTLLAEAKHFGIKSRQPAMEVVAGIHAVVSTWPEAFRKWNVPEKDAVSIGNDIQRRLKLTQI